jgi:O-antigen biosynthesis protein
MNKTGSNNTAFAQYKAGNLQQAANSLIKILESQPENVYAIRLLATICSELGNLDLAMACLDPVVKKNGQSDNLKSLLHDINQEKILETISLCMIVKNEENKLMKCLTYANPIVDEMIIIDTGSTDRTKKIARAFGAKVFDFTWTNNFSDARNFSLSKALGKWILVLDADEIIAFTEHETFRKLVKETTADSVAFSFIRRNYVTQAHVSGWKPHDGHYSREEAGTGFFTDGVVRLFPNRHDLSFRNPVHEHIEPSLIRMGIEMKECNVTVHHYGLLDDNKVSAKVKYYHNLGKTYLEQNGDTDFRVLYDFAVQTSTLGKYEEAIQYFEKVICIKPDFPLAFKSMGNAYFNLKRYKDAKSSYEKAMKFDPQLKHEMPMYPLCAIYTGNAEAAIPVLHALTEHNPSNPFFLFLFAVVFICTGRREEGIEYLSNLYDMKYDYKSSLLDITKMLRSHKKFDYALLLEEAYESINSIT